MSIKRCLGDERNLFFLHCYTPSCIQLKHRLKIKITVCLLSRKEDASDYMMERLTKKNYLHLMRESIKNIFTKIIF